jgi:large exoprotein involved in heme utilization and adhesion
VGNVTINVAEHIVVDGVNPITAASSGLGTRSFGIGNSGNTVVNTRKLQVLNGGLVGATTFAQGNAGQITINASELVRVQGMDQATGVRSSVNATAGILTQTAQQGFFVPDVPTGDTGSLLINTERLAVQDGGLIGVQHEGTGNAGQLEVNAQIIALDRGEIAATTAAGIGGNIVLNATKAIILDNRSRITAEALGGQGSGGNMTLDSPLVLGLGNSDIVANAVGGQGGNITIEALAIFGLRPRQVLTSGNDITASSQVGLSGTIVLNTPNTDVTSSLVSLPKTLSDPSRQITTGCIPDQGNRLALSGRGGLPATPLQPLQTQVTWQDLRFLQHLVPPEDLDSVVPEARVSRAIVSRESMDPTAAARLPMPLSLVEANGWTIDETGTVQLIATQPQSPTLVTTAPCQHYSFDS